jgi:Circularly permutated YpsA SLOG family
MVQLLLLPPRPRQSLDEHAIDATALCGYDSEMVERVISGGQTGADQAGLAAAKLLGIPTGGCMRRGWLTEDGSRSDLAAAYGLPEAETAVIPPWGVAVFLVPSR